MRVDSEVATCAWTGSGGFAIGGDPGLYAFDFVTGWRAARLGWAEDGGSAPVRWRAPVCVPEGRPHRLRTGGPALRAGR
jgi:hypothetical protein